MAKVQNSQLRVAEWAPERSIREVSKLLPELDSFSGKSYRDAERDEAGWRQRAVNLFIRAFASDSPNHQNLNYASGSGSYSFYEITPAELQGNFVERVSAYRTAVQTAIEDLKLSLPEPELIGNYESGDEYQFCRDLRNLFRLGSKEIFIIDPYLDQELFDLYVEPLAPSVRVRILTANPKNALLIVARKFASSRPHFEFRTTSAIHDRAIFIDDRCWVVGQSIKDAAKRKPTYIVEFSNERMKPTYDDLWSQAQPGF